MRSFNRLMLKLLLATAVTAPLYVSGSVAFGQAVTQGFATDTNLQQGMIVKLKSGDTTKVEPLTSAAVTQMHGVVVAADDSPVTLSDGTGAQQVYVATSGRYDVLVSNQNGEVHKNDYITISAISGVGMKADSSQSVVLGKAAADMSGQAIDQISASVQAGGHKKPLTITRLPVLLAISHNPLANNNKQGVPAILQQTGHLITGKQINPFRLYLSSFILIASLLAAIIILYSGVRTSVISIGRNPLAKKSILYNLAQVTAIGLIIFIIGLIAVYLLLKL